MYITVTYLLLEKMDVFLCIYLIGFYNGRCHSVWFETVNCAEIRENQKKAVLGFLNGKDVLLCSPTGSWKSIVFFFFFLNRHLHLVISITRMIYPNYGEWIHLEDFSPFL